MLPGVEAGGAGEDDLFGPLLLHGRNIVFGKLLEHPLDAGSQQRETAAPLILAQEGEIHIGGENTPM